MARLTPNKNDTEQVLWFKIAYNLYELAVETGISGLNSPSVGEPVPSLQKKATYYTAAIVDAS